MTDLIVFPDIVPVAIDFLNGLDPIKTLLDGRIGTQIPEEHDWPIVRLDPAGGIAPVEFRIDQPRIQVQSLALTDNDAIVVARTMRAGFAAMNGLYVPGVLFVTDVATTVPQIIESAARDSKLLRTPQLSHATFSVTITLRSDP